MEVPKVLPQIYNKYAHNGICSTSVNIPYFVGNRVLNSRLELGGVKTVDDTLHSVAKCRQVGGLLLGVVPLGWLNNNVMEITLGRELV